MHDNTLNQRKLAIINMLLKFNMMLINDVKIHLFKLRSRNNSFHMKNAISLRHKQVNKP